MIIIFFLGGGGEKGSKGVMFWKAASSLVADRRVVFFSVSVGHCIVVQCAEVHERGKVK